MASLSSSQAALPPLSRYDIASRLMIDAPAPDGTRWSVMELEAAIRALQRGSYVLKFGRSGQPQKRFVRVTDDGDAVYWLSRRKKLADSTIHFADVERIQRGQHTWTFARHGKAYGGAADRSLSIVVSSGRSLDLLFDTSDERNRWADALQALLLRQRMTVEDSDLRYLRHAFAAEDVSRCGVLTYSQVKSLLRRLNVYSNKATLKRILERVVAARASAAAAAAAPGAGAAAGGTLAGSSPSSSAAPAVAAPSSLGGPSLASGGGGIAGGAVAPGAAAPASSDPAALLASSNSLVAVAASSAGGTTSGIASSSGSSISFSSLTLSLADFIAVVDHLRDRPDVAAVYAHALRQCPAGAAPDAVCSCTHGGAAAIASSSLLSGGTSAAAAAPPPAHTLPFMSVAQFCHFLRFEQGEAGTSQDDAARLCAHFFPAGAGRCLSVAAFTAFLTSPANSAFAPEAACQSQDMSRPLAHYFIESSHNTYLEGDQLAGNSSVNMYISAVQKGCRCVELDAWDGPDGEPIIYHGHTLTGRIAFADVCRALAQFGFMTSRFPLILSLEIHCGHAQQQRMAEIMVEAFGERIVRPSPHRRAYYAHVAPLPPGMPAGTGATGAAMTSVMTTAVPAGAGATSDAWLYGGSTALGATASTTSGSGVSTGTSFAASAGSFASSSAGAGAPAVAAQLAALLPEFLTLPSPAELAGRVIIKAKIVKPGKGKVVAPPPASGIASQGSMNMGLGFGTSSTPGAISTLPSFSLGSGGAGGAFAAAAAVRPPAVDVAGGAGLARETSSGSLGISASGSLGGRSSTTLLTEDASVLGTAASAAASGAVVSPSGGRGSASSTTLSPALSGAASPRSAAAGARTFVSGLAGAASASAGSEVGRPTSPANLGLAVAAALTTDIPAVAAAIDGVAAGPAAGAAPGVPEPPERPLLTTMLVPALADIAYLHTVKLPLLAAAAAAAEAGKAHVGGTLVAVNGPLAASVDEVAAGPAPLSPVNNATPQTAAFGIPTDALATVSTAPATGTAGSDLAFPGPSSAVAAAFSASASYSAVALGVGMGAPLGGEAAFWKAAMAAAALNSGAARSAGRQSGTVSSAAVSTSWSTATPGPAAASAAGSDHMSLAGAAVAPVPKQLSPLGRHLLRVLAPCWHMSSVKETPAAKLIAKAPIATMAYLSRQLMRVYPGAFRIDSSNFNPAPYWAAGVQMVALNYQTCDVPLRLNRAFFRLNGRCGYVLKPPYMIEPFALGTAVVSAAPSDSAAIIAGANADSVAPTVTAAGAVSPPLLASSAAAAHSTQPHVLPSTTAAHEVVVSAGASGGSVASTDAATSAGVSIANASTLDAASGTAAFPSASAALSAASPFGATLPVRHRAQRDNAGRAQPRARAAGVGRKRTGSASSAVADSSGHPGRGDDADAEDEDGDDEGGAGDEADAHADADIEAEPSSHGHSDGHTDASVGAAQAAAAGTAFSTPQPSKQLLRHLSADSDATGGSGSEATPLPPSAVMAGGRRDTGPRRAAVMAARRSALGPGEPLPVASSGAGGPASSPLVPLRSLRPAHDGSGAGAESAGPVDAAGLSLDADGEVEEDAAAAPHSPATAVAAAAAPSTSSPWPSGPAAPASGNGSGGGSGGGGGSSVPRFRPGSSAPSAAAAALRWVKSSSPSSSPRRPGSASVLRAPQPSPLLLPHYLEATRAPPAPVQPQLPLSHVGGATGAVDSSVPGPRPGFGTALAAARTEPAPTASSAEGVFAGKHSTEPLARSPLRLGGSGLASGAARSGAAVAGIGLAAYDGSSGQMLKHGATLHKAHQLSERQRERVWADACFVGDALRSLSEDHDDGGVTVAEDALASQSALRRMTSAPASITGGSLSRSRLMSGSGSSAGLGLLHSSTGNASLPLPLPPPLPAGLGGLPGSIPLTLSVTIMGAQHLPKRGAAASSAAVAGGTTASLGGTGVPSPFCSVIVYGDAGDAAKCKTRVVPDNGFNPVWRQTFTFTLRRPEVAVLYLAVHDQVDVAALRTAFLAYAAVPVAALRAGYRSCPLRNALGKKYPFCSLLCRFETGLSVGGLTL